MKTNEEIQREALRMLGLGRSYRDEHRGTAGEVVPLPRVLVQLPDVQVTRKAETNSPGSASQLVNRHRHIEAAIENDALIFRLMERETTVGDAATAVRSGEPTAVMVSRSGFDLLQAGYERVEEDRLFERLAPYAERIDERDERDPVDEQEVAEVEAALETHLLLPSDRLRMKADVVAFLEGRVEARVLIAHTIDRMCAREGQRQGHAQHHEPKLTVNESCFNPMLPMLRFLDSLSFSQPYLIGLLFVMLIVLITPGCATASPDSAGRTRDFATTAATTAGGAYIGAREGEGKAKNAAVGAGAGFVVGEAINYFNNKAQREAFLAGYEKGQSNAVKQQYWIARDNHRPRTDDGYEEAYYEIPVPPSERDGVRREPTKRVIRVVVPKEEAGS